MQLSFRPYNGIDPENQTPIGVIALPYLGGNAGMLLTSVTDMIFIRIGLVPMVSGGEKR